MQRNMARVGRKFEFKQYPEGHVISLTEFDDICTLYISQELDVQVDVSVGSTVIPVYY